MFTHTSTSYLTLLTFLLTAIGAINWGLIGIFNFNLVEFLLGSFPSLVKTIYSLVGLSGLYAIWLICEACSSKEKLSK